MSRPPNRNGDGDLVTGIMNFIKWAHHNGGVSLILICSGVFILTLFAVLMSMGIKESYPALIIGSIFFVIGLVLHLEERKKDEFDHELDMKK